MNELEKAVVIAIKLLRGDGLDSLLDISPAQANQLADFLADVLNGANCQEAYDKTAASRR